MNFWFLYIGMAFILSVCLSGIVIPKILLIAFRKNLFDEPDERKIHTSLVPRLGGIAFKPVITFTLSLIVGINKNFGDGSIFHAVAAESCVISYVYCAIMLLYLLGIGDDLVGIRYRAKFIFQIISAMMLVAGGLYISNFHGFLGIYELGRWFAYPLTILVVVFIINAMNLIDGIDGLASGLSSVAMLYYFFIFVLYGEYFYAVTAIATLGVLIPFFFYNVFGDPTKQKKIFMGDTGTLTIGILICFLSFKMSMMPATAGQHLPNPLISAFSPLLVPCFDVIRVYMGRVRRGVNPFLPDKTHIHHKLLAIGMQQRVAMVSILMVSLLFTFCNIGLSYYLDITYIVGIDAVVWTTANMWLSKKRTVVRCSRAS